MLTLILVFIIVFILYRLLHHFLIARKLDPYVVIVLLIVLLVPTVYLGVFSAISGFNNWEIVEETSLINSSNSDVSIQTEITLLIPADIFASSISYEDIEKIESPTCTKPVLRKCKRHAKRSIWTFGLQSQEKYILYVPEGTNINKITLK